MEIEEIDAWYQDEKAEVFRKYQEEMEKKGADKRYKRSMTQLRKLYLKKVTQAGKQKKSLKTWLKTFFKK